ncbi:MAG: DNA-protecting protein DprA, partial [Alphaproteobacteria bacterium]|nr:DNA-protecting protein DprA [Alphaproteobacteria bacterium]
IGSGTLLARDMIAIVGARNASALGRKFAGSIAEELSAAGLVVVSGMARGIDSAAHIGSLKNGTCAVVAGGIDYVYPPENEQLYREICAQGVVVSELPAGLVPQARHFPRRNRIISGLARGVVVVEAAEGSGSLITANFALEQNREIFAVPGSPLDPRARGTNRLLREGAILTESVADVMSVLGPILGRTFSADASPPRPEKADETDASDSTRRAVEEALGPAPVGIDELVRQTSVPAGEVLIVLLELELAGRVTRQPGNRFAWA